MTARQPRRDRRRSSPASTLPRPVAAPEGDQPAAAAAARASARRTAVHHRQHHVTRDYGHVHKDLITVAVVGSVVIAFIVAMSFVI
jgi:hypothetical protein